MEKQLSEALSSRDSAKQSLDSAEEATKKQIKTLEDMLHWEKERSGKQEAEAKSQKKLLVKEVKALRIQLSQMTTERDAYVGGGEAARASAHPRSAAASRRQSWRAPA